MLPDPGSFVLWECVDGSPTSGWRYCNPELNALYAAGRSTVDMDERTTVYQRMQQIFYEEVPAVNILVPPSVFGLQSRVEGFTPTANIWVSSWNIHEWTVTE
jgi:ABC-type transport system substrate-binding protein